MNVTTTSYTWTGLTNGTTYYFVVTAVNIYGESGESMEVSATPLISLFFDDFDPTIDTTLWSSYTGTGLTNNTTYYFVVTAVNIYGESVESSEVSATPFGWTISTIDSTGSVGQYTSIAMDSNNNVHISYYDFSNTALKYATNASGSWVTSTIDSIGDVGKYTSIAIDSNDSVHISYYDYTNYDLKYATNASGSWVRYIVEKSGTVGLYTSIAVDSNDNVHISYYDYTNGDLKYATNQ